jgi:hypothetical protein
MEQLLTQIDSIKQKITDQEYREMMDSLKTIHEKEKKYELTIAVMKNENEHIITGGIPKFGISIMRYIPTIFDTHQLEKYLTETKENGCMIDAVPLCIRFSTGEVTVDWDETEPMRIKKEEEECQGCEDCPSCESTKVAEYVKYNLIAVREI